eukprot:1074661-Prorocentrum_minimum.AAC.1
MEEAREYSHDGPIRRRNRGHILTMDQSAAGSAGIFSRWTNQTQEPRAYSHNGPIGNIGRNESSWEQEPHLEQGRLCDWSALLEYMLSPLVRLVRTPGICSLPSCDWITKAHLEQGPCDWFALLEYALFPRTIG